ncbi:CRISPR-associated helicase Cas3' [Kitasatospora sp. NPDC004289]
MVPDVRLAGKRDGLPAAYPVICHLLDVAAAAGALWDGLLSERMRVRLADELGVSLGMARRMVMLWAGLHDVGKIIPEFQERIADGSLQHLAGPGYEAGPRGEFLTHQDATHWSLVEFFEGCGYGRVDTLVKSSPSHQIAQLLGGHHGSFSPVLQSAQLKAPAKHQPGLGIGAGWREQRLVHAEVVRRLTGAGGVPKKVLPGWAAVVVAGLVVVADWLASQEEVIVDRMPPEGWVAGEPELGGHFEAAVGVADGWVREAGLGRAVFEKRTFGEQFDFKANPLQKSLAEDLPKVLAEARAGAKPEAGAGVGSGLLLVTAPTGDGKTEAALHAASVLARSSGASGLYFALPTMATADSMFKRVRKFSGRNVGGDRALALLHSMAWLSPEYALPAQVVDGSRVLADLEASEWLRTGKRGLLAPLANGTIDQVLAGVLPLKYGFLRLFGLSDKVLVVDEAHAYGPWMHSLLVRLLQWLGAQRVPVVLLSATLTGSVAASLVNAYRRGAGHRVPAVVEPCYPGWLFVDAASGEVSKPREVKSERERTLHVRTVRVEWDVRAEPGSAVAAGGRREVLRRLLTPVAAEGGCVLVACTTVDEAQRTYRDLQAALPELACRDGGLRLLHSRFPAFERERISGECEAAYGKPVSKEAAAGVRTGSVLVATQIVEQSLDLDFDLVVSDLAPLAQLLQRAGRGKRHEREGRPGWCRADGAELGDPRLVVLEPLGADGTVAAPRSWGTVYDASLLRRTSVLLGRPGSAAIAVPRDVQRLVDEVYAEDFGAGLDDAAKRELARMDAERLAGEVAEGQLADFTAIRPPYEVRGDLSLLSQRPVAEELLTTRLGADSGRVVCVYVQEGKRTLDAEGRVPVPGEGPGGGRMGREEIALVMRHTVPLPGRWLEGAGEGCAVPDAWKKWPVLAGLKVLPMRQDGQGAWSCVVGGRAMSISDIGISSN